MKYSVITLLILLAGCASQAQLDEYERGMVNDIYCPGEVDESYSMTIYSSDNPEKIGEVQVTTRCQPIKTQTDFETENRRK